jgi:hypothetical protein
MDEREELLLEIRATLDKATKYLKIITTIVVFFTAVWMYESWVARGLYGLPWW